jgi:hypothetical protein
LKRFYFFLGELKMIDAKDFCAVYLPAAREGKSAAEIGELVGFSGDDKQRAVKVSVRASQLRKQFVELAKVKAKENKLKKAETDELVEKAKAKIPRLKSPGRASKIVEVEAFVDDLWAKLEKAEKTTKK